MKHILNIYFALFVGKIIAELQIGHYDSEESASYKLHLMNTKIIAILFSKKPLLISFKWLIIFTI